MPAPSRAELIAECIWAVACPHCEASAEDYCSFSQYGDRRGTGAHHKRELVGMKLFHQKYGKPLGVSNET